MHYSRVSPIVFHESRFFNVDIRHRTKRNFVRYITRAIWKLICTSYIGCKAPTSPFAILKEDKSPKEFLTMIQRQVRKSERAKEGERRGQRDEEEEEEEGEKEGAWMERLVEASKGARARQVQPRPVLPVQRPWEFGLGCERFEGGFLRVCTRSYCRAHARFYENGR